MISIIENTRWVYVTHVFSIGYNKTKSLTDGNIGGKLLVLVRYGSFLNIVLAERDRIGYPKISFVVSMTRFPEYAILNITEQ